MFVDSKSPRLFLHNPPDMSDFFATSAWSGVRSYFWKICANFVTRRRATKERRYRPRAGVKLSRALHSIHGSRTHSWRFNPELVPLSHRAINYVIAIFTPRIDQYLHRAIFPCIISTALNSSYIQKGKTLARCCF